MGSLHWPTGMSFLRSLSCYLKAETKTQVVGGPSIITMRVYSNSSMNDVPAHRNDRQKAEGSESTSLGQTKGGA